MEVTIHIGKNNRATLICPKCSWAKTIDVTPYINVKKKIKLKIRCRCENTYIAVLDRRKSFRKKTDFYGTFVKVPPPETYTAEKDGPTGEMIVVDLSRGGLRFRVVGEMCLRPDDHIRVEFHLDDRNRSKIQKHAVVRNIKGLEVGAQFVKTDPSDADTVAIGFYLLSNP